MAYGDKKRAVVVTMPDGEKYGFTIAETGAWHVSGTGVNIAKVLVKTGYSVEFKKLNNTRVAHMIEAMSRGRKQLP